MPHGLRDRAAQEMMDIFVPTGHLAFCGASLVSKGQLRSNGGGKTSIHFNGEPDAAYLLLRTDGSVSQLSIYGATTDWYDELAQRAESHPSPGTRPPVVEVSDHEAPQVPSDVVSSLTKGSLWSLAAHGDLLRQHDEKLEIIYENLQFAKVSADAGFTFRKASTL